jgi:hypothetical protein
MFDVYLYDQDTGDFIEKRPCQSDNNYKRDAMRWHSQGFLVKVVDLFDGVVVYTLG